ncbi:MAG: cytochrome c oxidase assembly protein [Caldilineaceae bacterium]
MCSIPITIVFLGSGASRALEDQTVAGVIMWIPGSMMMLLAVILLLASALRGTDENPPQPVANWDSEDAMVAPGLEHRVIQNRWHRVQQAQLPPDRVSNDT